MTQQKKASELLFWALGECLVLVTGAWCTKPHFHVPAVIFMPAGLQKEAREAWQGGQWAGLTAASFVCKTPKWAPVKGRAADRESEDMLETSGRCSPPEHCLPVKKGYGVPRPAPPQSWVLRGCLGGQGSLCPTNYLL